MISSKGTFGRAAALFLGLAALGACSSHTEDGATSAEAVSAAGQVGTLTFGSDITVDPSVGGSIVAGGKLSIRYDDKRILAPGSTPEHPIHQCEVQHDGFQAWSITAGIKFLPSNKTIEDDTTAVYAPDPADTHQMKALEPVVDVPVGTTSIEVWIHAKGGAQSPCDFYDSKFGQNYTITVGALGATLSWGAELTQDPSVSGVITAGKKIALEYSDRRMLEPGSDSLHQCENQHDGFEAWQIRAGVKFVPSNKVIEDADTAVYVPDPADTHVMKARVPVIDVPAGTTSIEVWFHSQSGAQSTCDFYDSKFGDNYVFTVAR